MFYKPITSYNYLKTDLEVNIKTQEGIINRNESFLKRKFKVSTVYSRVIESRRLKQVMQINFYLEILMNETNRKSKTWKQ